MKNLKRSPRKKATSRKSVRGQSNQSQYDVAAQKYTLTSENAWLRLLIIGLPYIERLVLVYLLHQYALPLLGIPWLCRC